MKRVVAGDEASLERLTGYVHDAWFDVDQIRQEADVVSIPLALRGVRVKRRFRPSQIELAEYESLLAVHGVDEFEVDEPEPVRFYMVSEITFAPPHVTVRAEPNCTVTLHVGELDVRAELRMAPYEWSVPGATAIVVPFRAAEAALSEHRRAHTPSGRDGMPAHATLLAPFVHASRLDSFDRRRMRDTIGRFPAFDVRLPTFGLFEEIGCLYLEPRPREPFVEMSQALLEVYPEVEFPPEGKEIVPHVTIGSHLTEEQQEEVRRAVAPNLPVRARVDRAVLYERDANGRWQARQTFALS